MGIIYKFKYLFIPIALIVLGGTTSFAKEYIIENSLDFEILARKAVNEGYTFEGDTIYIKADIKVEALTFTEFNGIMLGEGHKITVTAPLVDKLGATGVIANLVLDSKYRFESTKDCGTIAIKCHGAIINCENYVSLEVTNYSDTYFTGGICAIVENTGRIIGCTNYSNVNAFIFDADMKNYPCAGGIAGISHGVISGCTNKGSVRAIGYQKSIAGGIVGISAEGSHITGCSNSGNVATNITGLQELASNIIHQYCGGIAGKISDCILYDCVNSGRVTNTCDYVAGIVAHAIDSDIINCTNTGYIESEETYFFQAPMVFAVIFQVDQTYAHILLTV